MWMYNNVPNINALSTNAWVKNLAEHIMMHAPYKSEQPITYIRTHYELQNLSRFADQNASATWHSMTV